MHINPTAETSLRRVFNEGFGARDIAEPLMSFDASADANEALTLMHERDFDVVGIRKDGFVDGFVERGDATKESGEWNLQAISKSHIVVGTTTLTQVVLGLRDSRRLFVSAFGTIVKGLERLRNNLAHSQEMIVSDWETIRQLAENLDDILTGPPGLRADANDART